MQPLPPSPIKLFDVEKVLEVRDVASAEKVVVEEVVKVVEQVSEEVSEKVSKVVEQVSEEVSEKVSNLVNEVKTSSCWVSSFSLWWSRSRCLPAKSKVLSKEPPAE